LQVSAPERVAAAATTFLPKRGAVSRGEQPATLWAVQSQNRVGKQADPSMRLPRWRTSITVTKSYSTLA
jgi:hypothetical protein